MRRTVAFEVLVLGWVAVRVSRHWIWQANIVAVVPGVLVRSVPLDDIHAGEDAVVDSGTSKRSASAAHTTSNSTPLRQRRREETY